MLNVQFSLSLMSTYYHVSVAVDFANIGRPSSNGSRKRMSMLKFKKSERHRIVLLPRYTKQRRSSLKEYTRGCGIVVQMCV